MSVNVDFKHVDTAENALLGQGLGKAVVAGVFIVDVQFARGYDLKLAVDALVIVVDNDESLDLSTAQQMAGRASRAQTVQNCHIFVVSSFLKDTVKF